MYEWGNEDIQQMHIEEVYSGEETDYGLHPQGVYSLVGETDR